jgi:cAMP-binding proteins - catabolite gene activator and regulatory subunit of cAMP-dependent protein kinases
MINSELLEKYGGSTISLPKGKMLFQENDTAFFYYQIIEGSMKMNNYDEEGNETIQGIFKAGQSFGEPAIFGDFPYPANAEATEATKIIKLEKSRLLDMVSENPQVALHLLSALSRRLRFKAILSKEIKSYDAEHRIMTLFELINTKKKPDKTVQVNITRQTIANLTGLRVETVIRTIKKLEEKALLEIKKGKIYI